MKSRKRIIIRADVEVEYSTFKQKTNSILCMAEIRHIKKQSNYGVQIERTYNLREKMLDYSEI